MIGSVSIITPFFKFSLIIRCFLKTILTRKCRVFFAWNFWEFQPGKARIIRLIPIKKAPNTSNASQYRQAVKQFHTEDIKPSRYADSMASQSGDAIFNIPNQVYKDNADVFLKLLSLMVTMNIRTTANAFALILLGLSYSALANSDLCSTVTFEAFGEPKQTLRDCADPYESFWVALTIDGKRFMTQGLGLVVPQTSSQQRGDEMQSLTIQVTKNNNEYTVRFLRAINGQSIYWSGIMLPGHQQDVTIKGHKVNIRFERQKN
ncbi:hypothetical protein AB6896_00070 [Rahnella inusitata]|uniref:hypothetical protein n=1 Tax=Rahnella inusitata TaxID=58169 RepID=UPI0039BE8328